MFAESKEFVLKYSNNIKQNFNEPVLRGHKTKLLNASVKEVNKENNCLLRAELEKVILNRQTVCQKSNTQRC